MQQAIWEDIRYFPIPISTLDQSLKTAFADSWMTERSYGGKRGHEGTDIMASENVRGLYPVVSITDGVVENLGWLPKGDTVWESVRHPEGIFITHIWILMQILRKEMLCRQVICWGLWETVGMEKKEQPGNFRCICMSESMCIRMEKKSV